MHKGKQSLILAIVLALAGLAIAAQAQPPREYRRDDRQIGQILPRIDQRAARFQNAAERALTDNRMDNTRREGKLTQFVSDFRQAIAQLRNNYNRRQATDADVQAVLETGGRIDSFLLAHPGLTGVDDEWRGLRGDLDSLASAYNIAWNWDEYNRRDNRDDRDYRGDDRGNRGGAAARLSGTFKLNPAQSDDARSIVERAVRTLPYSDRQRASERLLRRMEAPDMLSIDRQGRTITLASSRAPQMTFDADGREQVEQIPDSQRTMRVVANLTGDQLRITTTGNRDTDFTVTFDPINGGRQLRVTRSLSSDRLDQPVVVQSTYDQVSPTARWDLYNGGPGYGNDRSPNDRGGNYNSGDFFVPDGALVVGRLNDNLDTTRARAGDRFTLTVSSPPEYRGATIEGHVGDVNRSGRVTGRAELALNFDSIRMRDGRTSRFEGTLDSVRTANGETLRVDTEGAVRDNSSQTGRTVTRTAVGSAIGAVIGAIAGGGKGAAVGAVVGGGAGAGSVIVQGRNDLQLTSGTEITIRASSPNRRL
jgi:hypothetical protein